MEDRLARKILLVDDDPMLCQLFATALVRYGFDVESTYSGVDALEYFNDHEVDLIVLDFMMAGLDGADVVSTIRLTSKVPILILSARTDSVTKLRGISAGANDYLFKPITPDVLIARIRAILGDD